MESKFFIHCWPAFICLVGRKYLQTQINTSVWEKSLWRSVYNQLGWELPLLLLGPVLSGDSGAGQSCWNAPEALGAIRGIAGEKEWPSLVILWSGTVSIFLVGPLFCRALWPFQQPLSFGWDAKHGCFGAKVPAQASCCSVCAFVCVQHSWHAWVETRERLYWTQTLNCSSQLQD